MTQSGGRDGARRWLPVVAPLLLALVFWWFGHPARSWVLVALAAVAFVLIVVGVPVERSIARGAAWLAHRLGVLLGLGVGLVLVATGAVLRLIGVDPLTPRRDRAGGWLRAPESAAGVRLAASTFGLEGGHRELRDGRGRHGALHGAVFAVGVLAVLVLADLGVGLAWERLSGAGAPLESVQTKMNFTGETETVEDVRADLPAMAAYPWADAYFREIQRTPYGYWPFTESRPLGFDGEYVNLEGWTRRTYQPADLPADAPVVWMFGGSTTWGEGQRDDYTIASYLARIAEEEGTPIRVLNYGQRGWTHFQEMILFEQLLAAEPAPAVAIFYDGANEINAQTLGAQGVPTHLLTDQYARTLTGQGVQGGAADGSTAAPSAAASAWTVYAGHSAMGKLIRWIERSVTPDAGASPARSDRTPTQQGGDGGSTDGEDLGTIYEKSVDDAVRAVDVYERGRRLTEYLADEAGVVPLFLWQPQMAGPAEEWANDAVAAPTVDISDTLDDRQDVYIDGGHTNEEGAELVAERIWTELAPALDAAAGRSSSDRGERRSGAAAAPTTASLIATAERTFESVRTNPCALGVWSAQLGTLRAGSADDAARIGELAANFFTVLSASVPPGGETARAQLLGAAQAVREQAPVSVVDPEQPFVPQLPFTRDLTFVPAIETVLSSIAARPDC